MRPDLERSPDLGDAPLDARERSALDAWAVPALPDDFVARATARVLDDQRRSRRRARSLLALTGAAALAAALLLAAMARLPAPAPLPTTLTIGAATLTCAGCTLSIAPAPPKGDSMNATTAGIVGAATGAAVAAAILVTVHSGHVVAHTDAASPVSAGPGEQLVIAPGGPPPLVRRVPDAAPPPRRPASAATSAATQPQAGEAASCPEAAAATSRAEQLQLRVEALERELRARRSESDSVRAYGLPRETLVEMAERCELRWDVPPMAIDGAQTVTRTAVESLGLDDAQIRAINDVFARTNVRMLEAVTAIYAEVMGDAPPAGMAPTAMLFEITDKTARESIREVFQRLSAEKAGLAPPPDPAAILEPAERLFRLLTTVGDEVERELAAKVGPDVARALRDEHGGWGEKSRSRPGCPGGE